MAQWVLEAVALLLTTEGERLRALADQRTRELDLALADVLGRDQHASWWRR